LASKLLLGALVFVVVGLVLMIYPDPQFRLIFSGGATSGFPTTRFDVGNGTGFPRNFTGGFNFTRGAGAGAAARDALLGFNTASILESILGVGLISVGVVLIAVEMFLTPSKIK
jgi:hypothetical protein